MGKLLRRRREKLARKEICKFCHDAINDVRPSVKVIYTPMGNGR